MKSTVYQVQFKSVIDGKTWVEIADYNTLKPARNHSKKLKDLKTRVLRITTITETVKPHEVR